MEEWDFCLPTIPIVISICWVRSFFWSSSLWHKRLGYLSNFVVEKLLGQSSLIKNKPDKLCSICLHAKKTHNSFPLSSHNVVMIFDLIHYDLWSPYNTTYTYGSFYFLTILDDQVRFGFIF